MNFLPSRSAAIEQLERFIENNLNQYAKLRNFDYGSKKRNNISCLSPYISHGIINETEVIDKSLKKFSFTKNEKFIQEVLWRVYWKGWLELRPTVWKDYLSDLEKIRKDYTNDQDYKNAINGSTNLKCFNEWVKELKETITYITMPECGLLVFGFLHLNYLGNWVQNSFYNICSMVMLPLTL